MVQYKTKRNTKEGTHVIEFHTPRIEDLAWADPCLKAVPRQACEYSFTNLLGWSGPYGQEIARWGDLLLTRLQGPLNGCYLWPAGTGDERAAIEALAADAGERGCPLRLVAVPAGDKDKLEAWWPGRFHITPDRDGFDYCYGIDKMCELTGKKLHGKRNHINRFLEANEGRWSFAPMTRPQLAECLEMEAEWRRRSLGREVSLEEFSPETTALLAAATHYDALGMDGGVLRVYGEVVAFTMGTLLTPDTYDIHFEKAYGELQGAYPMIARQFARLIRDKYPGVRWLNREDDMGVEGLRKAKESYYPDLMIEKFTALEK